MFTFSQFKANFIPQIILVYVFLISGLIVNFLGLLALIFVWPFNRPLYNRINYYLALLIWSHITSLGQWWCPTQFDMFMEPEDFKMVGKENVIVICNHRYNLDWLMGWLLSQRTGLLGGSKCFLKSVLQYVPVLGFSWWSTDHIFCTRKWENDEKSFAKTLKNILDYPKDLVYSFVIFCEGTRLTKEKHEASMEVARSKGMPELKHHLLPRTKGFFTLANKVSSHVKYVYDLNFGLADINGRPSTLKDLKNGEMFKLQILMRRIPLSSIQIEDEAKCNEFVHQLYREKDKIHDVYATKGDFSSIGVPKVDCPKNKNDLYVSLSWIVLILVPTFYYLLNFVWLSTWYVKIGLVVFLLLSNYMINWLILKQATKTTQKNKGA